MKLWGFLRFERNAHKPFSICGYSFQNGLGFQRDGSSFGSGFPIGAGSALLAMDTKGTRCLGRGNPMEGRAFLAGRIQRNRRFRGTRLCPQSLVCYTFGDRGWRKGVVQGSNERFQPATEQAGSASSRTRSPGVCDSRIRLFGCRWCGGAERISEEILGAQRHHRGSQRDIKPPSRRSVATPQMKSPFLSAASHSDNSEDRRYSTCVEFCLTP